MHRFAGIYTPLATPFAADRSPVPVLPYNVTIYTAVNLLPEAAVNLCGYDGGIPRPPLLPASQSAVDQIRQQLTDLPLLETTHASR